MLFTFLRSTNCKESKIVEWEVAEIDLSEVWNSSQDSCEWFHPQKAVQFIHSMQPIILSSSFQHFGRENTTQHGGVSLFCDGAMEVEKLSTPGCTLCYRLGVYVDLQVGSVLYNLVCSLNSFNCTLVISHQVHHFQFLSKPKSWFDLTKGKRYLETVLSITWVIFHELTKANSNWRQ